jgi:hypothetical protein
MSGHCYRDLGHYTHCYQRVESLELDISHLCSVVLLQDRLALDVRDLSLFGFACVLWHNCLFIRQRVVFYPRRVRVYLHFHMVSSSSLLSTHVFMYGIDSDGVVFDSEAGKRGLRCLKGLKCFFGLRMGLHRYRRQRG